MNKKLLSALTFSVFAASAIAVAGAKSPLSVRKALDCDHEGYHYVAKEANFTENGLHEWWTCCKCHETFDALSVLDAGGEWSDRDFANSEGGVPEAISTWEVLAPCALTDFTGTAVTDPSNINYAGGYAYATEFTGDGKTQDFHLLPFNMTGYSELKFSAMSLEGGWLEVFPASGSAVLQKNDANWHEIKVVVEDASGGGKKFQFYFDGGWQNVKAPVGDFSSDFISDYIKIKLGNGKKFLFSELLGKRDGSGENGLVVANNVFCEDAITTFDPETKTSTLTVGAHHAKKPVSALTLTPYDYIVVYAKHDSSNYIDITNGTIGDKSFAGGVWHAFQFVRADDGTWTWFLDNRLIYSGIPVNTLEGLNFSCNADGATKPFTFSQVFGHVRQGVTVAAEKAISNAVLGADGKYTWTSGGHYSEKAFADVNLTTYESLHLAMMPTAKDGYISISVNGTQVKDKSMNKVKYFMFDFVRNSTDSSKWDILFKGSALHSGVEISNLNEVSFGANSTLKNVPIVLTSIYGVLKETSLVASKVVSQSVLEGEAGTSTRFVAQDSRLTTSYQWGAGNGKHDVCEAIDITNKEYLVFYAFDTSTLNYYYGQSSASDDYIGACSASNSLVKFEFVKGASGWQIFVNGSAKKAPVNTNSFADLISFTDWSNQKSYFSELFGF